MAPIEKLAPGHAMYWKIGDEPMEVTTQRPNTERTRHSRKYIEGNLGPERAFYFRGREGKLKLKAHNLMLFMHIADGVDDDTWSYHLERNEYSSWVRAQVKDSDLADAIAEVENDRALSPDQSRAKIRGVIEHRYTLPADKPSGVVDRRGS
jgi:hypothetical protein